jgi:uncharacterized protein (DUF488 family)
MHTIYTIGYSGWKPEQLRDTIHALGAVLVDVRFSPRSRQPQWAGGNLAKLVGAGSYRHLKALGNENYKNGGPIKLVDTQAGVAALAPILAERPVVLLCGCKDHHTCHRTTAAHALATALGAQVEHLYPGSTPTGTSAAPAPVVEQLSLF